MSQAFPRRIKFLAIIITTLLFVLAGCSEGGMIQVPGFRDPTETPTPTLTETPTATLTPTATHTPLAPVGILLAPPEADQTLVNNLSTRLNEWIPAEGLRFQVRPSLSDADFQASPIQWVVAVPPVENLSALISGNPDTTFLVVGDAGLEPAENANLIGSGGFPLDQQGFMAGYIGAMITDDWRVGMIGIGNDPRSPVIHDAFVNGALFFCPAPLGFCSPLTAPFYEYPLYAEVPENAESADRRAVAQYLDNLTVDTFYVMPGAGDTALYQYLADDGKVIVGTVPPPEGTEDAWAASLIFSPLEAFDAFWPQFVEGVSGEVVDVPMTIEYVNASLLSPGRLRMAEEMLAKVQEGVIDLGGQPEP